MSIFSNLSATRHRHIFFHCRKRCFQVHFTRRHKTSPWRDKALVSFIVDPLRHGPSLATVAQQLFLGTCVFVRMSTYSRGHLGSPSHMPKIQNLRVTGHHVICQSRSGHSRSQTPFCHWFQLPLVFGLALVSVDHRYQTCAHESDRRMFVDRVVVFSCDFHNGKQDGCSTWISLH